MYNLRLLTKSYDVTIPIKVVLTYESVDEILWCDHSNKSY